MKTIYITYNCDVCHKGYSTEKLAQKCEQKHFNGLSDVKKALLLAEHNKKDICDYCEHSYYVYGCELDCDHKDCSGNNNFADFEETKNFKM